MYYKVKDPIFFEDAEFHNMGTSELVEHLCSEVVPRFDVEVEQHLVTKVAKKLSLGYFMNDEAWRTLKVLGVHVVPSPSLSAKKSLTKEVSKIGLQVIALVTVVYILAHILVTVWP